MGPSLYHWTLTFDGIDIYDMHQYVLIVLDCDVCVQECQDMPKMIEYVKLVTKLSSTVIHHFHDESHGYGSRFLTLGRHA